MYLFELPRSDVPVRVRILPGCGDRPWYSEAWLHHYPVTVCRNNDGVFRQGRCEPCDAYYIHGDLNRGPYFRFFCNVLDYRQPNRSFVLSCRSTLANIVRNNPHRESRDLVVVCRRTEDLPSYKASHFKPFITDVSLNPWFWDLVTNAVDPRRFTTQRDTLWEFFTPRLAVSYDNVQKIYKYGL